MQTVISHGLKHSCKLACEHTALIMMCGKYALVITISYSFTTEVSDAQLCYFCKPGVH